MHTTGPGTTANIDLLTTAAIGGGGGTGGGPGGAGGAAAAAGSAAAVGAHGAAARVHTGAAPGWHHLREALVRRTAQLAHAHGVRRVALFGAGRHTERFGVAFWRASGIEVVAVLDDAGPRPGRERAGGGSSGGGVPVLTPARWLETREPAADAVVLSSDAHEPALTARARELFPGAGVPVYMVYGPASAEAEREAQEAGAAAQSAGASGVPAPPAIIEVRVRGVDGGERVIRMADAGGASRWRAQTLLSKEPETIAWLERVRPGEVVWDVGANVGCYTLYAAAARGARVVAFEPGAANYAALNENVRLSGVGDRVTALCVALAERTGLAPLHMRFVEAGGACAAFGEARDEAGRAFAPVFSQGMLGMSVDDLVSLRGVEPPDHIKLDVDGLEEAILRGAGRTLREGRVKSLSVEIDDAGAGSVERIAGLLREAGFVHAGKFQGQQGPESRGSTIFNHHFVRPSSLVGGAGASASAGSASALLMAGAPAPVSNGSAPAAGVVVSAGVAHASTTSSVAPNSVAPNSVAPNPDARFDEDPVEHVRYVLRNAERSDWPFTHLVADAVFPAWYYREALRLFPAPAHFTPLNAAHPTRGSLMLTPKPETGRAELERLRGEQRAFWEEFARRFATREVCREMLLAMGGAPLLERFGERCEPLVHLAYDGLGYAIHPHCDVDRKVVTMIFYLPPDDAAAAYGTSVLVERADAGHLSPESWERYRVAKTVAFVPNRCFGFLVGSRSWHGVRPVERPTPRRSVQFFVTMPA